MRLLSVALLLIGCDKKSEDIDGDGYSVEEGDCWDSLDDPKSPEGAEAYGVKPWNIHPGSVEQFYDGIDQNCDGKDDFDQDLDGYVPEQYVGIPTLQLTGSGELQGGDCYDLPDELLPEERLGTSGFRGDEIHPDSLEKYYDGIDQDCDGFSDFDQDLDGYIPDRFVGIETQLIDGGAILLGGDCYDSEDDVFEGLSSEWDPATINPAVDEIWYDGIDSNCDGMSDYDQDGDGFDSDQHGGADCNDEDVEIAPDGRAEIYYNGKDDNCDPIDQDGDKDGDGFWSRVYPFATNEVDISVQYPSLSSSGDCWDDDENQPENMVVMNNFAPLAAADVKPNAVERFYDGVDQNCLGDGDFDADADGFTTMHYPDLDGNYGNDCVDSTSDPGFVLASGLSPIQIKPGNFAETYYDGVDQNCDGLSDFDADLDGQDSTMYGGTDCDDSDPNRYFDATGILITEIVANLIDENCDGQELCYIDVDHDGYGNTSGNYDLSNTIDCSEVGFSSNTNDCNDLNINIYPSAPEVCDGISNSCGGVLTPNEMDNDFDGYVECSIISSGWIGDPSVIGGDDCDDNVPDLLGISVDADCDTVLTDDDCDDNDPLSVYDMDCDGVLADDDCDDLDANVLSYVVDLDCDSVLNEDDCDDYDPSTIYDMDCDGVLTDDDCDDFDPLMLAIINDTDCDGVLSIDDCDDSDDTVYPNAPEICDGQVNNCNDSSGLSSDEIDNDGDHYVECDIGDHIWAGNAQVTGGLDCNDANALIHPYAEERSGGTDMNCDGMEDLGYPSCVSEITGNGTRQRYFLFCEEGLSWFDARLACLDGGYVGLAKIEYSNENLAVETLLTTDSWIGLNDVSETSAQENEGTFVWGDGTALGSNYVNWDGGTTPIDISRNCVYMNETDGMWLDQTCSSQQSFVCSSIVP